MAKVESTLSLGGSGSTPNLQQVTDVGNTTTNEIVIQGANNELAIYDNGLVFSSDLGAPLLVAFSEQENPTIWSFPNDESLDPTNFKLFASREWVADQVLVKNVTYSELLNLRNNNSLTKNKVYYLTDYMTTYTQPVTGVYKESGIIEPLYVIATDVNKLHNECRSKLYPQDIVYYNIDDTTEGFTKGKIYRRFDTLKNNDIGTDWRHVKYDRSGIDKLLFDDTVILQSNTIKTYDLMNTVISGGGIFYKNIIGDEFAGNTINGGNFSNNTIDNEFVNNTISGSFFGNKIGMGFGGNTLTATNFSFNSVVFDFYGNTITNIFERNTIDTAFSFNTITSVFSYNKIRSDFMNNVINMVFYENDIDMYFQSNTLSGGGDFSNNRINKSFDNNDINYDFNGNDIKSSFGNNTINKLFAVCSTEQAVTDMLFNIHIIGCKFNTMRNKTFDAVFSSPDFEISYINFNSVQWSTPYTFTDYSNFVNNDLTSKYSEVYSVGSQIKVKWEDEFGDTIIEEII